MSEAEVRELHRRIVTVMVWGARNGITRAQFRELARLRMFLDWLLAIQNKTARDWSTKVLAQLDNVEGLQRAYYESQRRAEP